jgi:WD40 repeat protein
MEDQATSNFYVAGGTLPPDTPSYVERQADNELYERALAGDFCYVLTSRQMGKSSLMARTAARLKAAGVETAVVDLTRIGAGEGAEDEKSTAEKWYKGVARAITRSLNLKADLNAWWREREDLPALQRLTEFFSDVVLAHTANRVVIFVDEIDTTIKLPFADDFFAAIRACYNARATEAEYNRLSFVLLGVASPSDLIKDTTRTPFNIGHRIDLTDFTAVEAEPLAQGLGATAEQGQQALRRILHWTGGHPYLTQRLCQAAAQGPPEEDSTAEPEASIDAGIDALVERHLLSPQASREDSNLNFVRDRVTKNARWAPAMLKLYRRIRRGEKVIDDTRSPVYTGLKLAGLVTPRTDRSLRVRNRVYEHIFTDGWAKKAMPVDRRRQAIASAMALLLVGFGLWYTLFLPNEYVRQLQTAADDYPAVAYAKLHRLPGFGVKADELLAQYWERRALREERLGNRDKALLSRLQAVSVSASDLRRSEANRLVGADYNNLLMTYRHGEFVNAVAFSLSSKNVLTTSVDRTVRIWDIESGQFLLSLRRDSASSNLFKAFFPLDWQGKFSANTTGDYIEGKLGVGINDLNRILQHDSSSNAITFSSDRRYLLTSGTDNTARLWRVDSGQLLSTLRRDSDVQAIAFSQDGRLVLTASADSTMQLWRVDSGQLLSTMQHDLVVQAIAFSSDSKLILTGSKGGTVELWRVDSGQLLSTLWYPSDIYAVAFSPDNKFVLTGNRLGIAGLWSVDSKQLCSTLRHDSTVLAVAFSPDGKLALTGSGDTTARLWRVDSGQLLSTLRHNSYVFAVAFSPDSKFALTGSSDRTARLWQVDSGKLLAMLRYDSDINSIAFSPDGKRAIATTTNWIHLAAVSNEGLMHIASRRIPGPWRKGGFHFDPSDGSRLRIAWLPTGDSLKIGTLRFDIADASPLPGDPTTLLAEWSKRLALRFDEQQKIVPLWPVEAVLELWIDSSPR